MAQPTIAEIVATSARETGEFSLLDRALQTAGLSEALADPDASLSVFAPTDAAFIQLARTLGVTVADGDEDAAFDGIVAALGELGDPVALLSDVLLYHVAPEARTLHELTDAGEVTTAITGGATVTVGPDGIDDNDPDVTNPSFVEGLTDIAAANGIIQVIDSVLLPIDIGEARDPASSEVLIGDADANLLAGDGGDDSLLGRAGDDTLEGGNGNDLLLAGSGDDTLRGGAGDDLLAGGHGDDVLDGGTGDDTLVGGAGADRFLFDPSAEGEGHDTILDFELGTDQVVLRAVDVLESDPTIAGDDGAVQAADFDASPNWSLLDQGGNLAVEHPNGTITFAGVAFDETLDFATLVEVGALALAGFVQGDDGDNQLVGDGDSTTIDDLILGLGGNDALRGGSGDDILAGGAGSDRFEFDPSNANEGQDQIADFTIGEDSIVLDPADVLAASPDLDIGDGSLEAIFAGLDANDGWTLGANDDGDVVVGHPGGTITLNGVQAEAVEAAVGEVSFAAVGPAVVVLDSIIPVDSVV